MVVKLISNATETTPEATDLIPIARPADATARHATVQGIIDGVLDAVYVEVAGDTMTDPLTFSGTGRVTIDQWIGSAGVRAPGTKPATYVQHGLTGVWQFADATTSNQEHVGGTLKISTSMDRTVVPTMTIGWSADGVSPGNCEWQFEYLWIGANSATNAAAQETLTATTAASATSNGLVFTTFSGIDLPGATDQAMLFRVKRLSGGSNDTIADTVELRGMKFTYTSDKLGTGT